MSKLEAWFLVTVTVLALWVIFNLVEHYRSKDK